MDRLAHILDASVASGPEDTNGKVLGLAVVVVKKDGPIFSHAAGNVSLSPCSPPFTTSTATWVASCTKLVTTIAVLQLVDKKLVTLDQDVRPLVPDLDKLGILRGFDEDGAPKFERNDRPVTLRQLLTHTAGFGIDIADEDLRRWLGWKASSEAYGAGGKQTWRETSKRKRPEGYMTYTKDALHVPLKFSPGEGWIYGVGPDWAGIVLETLTGKSLGQYFDEHVFSPLGILKHHHGRDSKAQTQPGNEGHPTFHPKPYGGDAGWSFRRPDGTLKLGEPSVPLPGTYDLEAGGSGLFMSASAYGKVLSSLLPDSSSSPSSRLPGELLSSAIRDEMFRPQLGSQAENKQPIECLTRMLTVPPFRQAICPEFEPDTAVDSGLAGLLNMTDLSGKRRRRSLMWQGATNCRWWCDPVAGVAGVVVVNVQPHGDPVVLGLWDKVERAIYEELARSSRKS